MLQEEEGQMTESCCGRVYGSDVVRTLLGDSWHPGGLTLTGQLAHLVGLESNNMVLDVACGNGSTANFLAREFGCRVVGVDILPENAREASVRFVKNEFVVGDSHRLPLSNDSFDLAILECTLSSFRNKQLVLQEINRVLKSNAKVGISDVVVSEDIPDELKEAQFQGLCVAGALSLDEYSTLLERAGFEIMVRQNKGSEALEFVESIRKKLFLAQLLCGVGKIPVKRETIEYAKHLTTVSKKTIEEGKLGYAAIVARKMVE